MGHKIYLIDPAGKSHIVRREEHLAPLQVMGVTCPICKASPWHVRGADVRISADDRHFEGSAKCTGCDADVGMLRQETDTLFGLTEDRAVLQGRPRVY